MPDRDVFMARFLNLILLVCCSGLVWSDQLMLNGSAPYAYLNQEYYVVGLYLPHASSDPLYIFSDQTPKKIRMVISANRWSVRMWARDWQDNFSINNSVANVSERVQGALENFVSLPREDLLRGDEITVEYAPGRGSALRFNGDIVFVDPAPSLINAFLSVWIGELPPSREFRQRLLAGDGTSHSILELGVIPTDRLHIYAGWMRQDEERRLAQQAEEARLAAEKDLRAHQAEQLRLAELRAAQERQLAKLRAEAEQKEKQSALKVAPAPVSSLPVVSPVVVQAKPPAVLATEQYYFLQLLRWKIYKAFINEINPDVGVLSRAGGVVRCEFYVDRQGRVVRLSLEETEVKKVFADEVVRAIHVVAPRIKAPDELEGKKWQINMEYDFALERQAQHVIAMPQRPESLAVSE